MATTPPPLKPGAYLHTDAEIEDIAARIIEISGTKVPWPAIAAIALAVGNAVFSFGIIYTKVNYQEVEIAELNTKEDRDIDRLARIEAMEAANNNLLLQHIQDMQTRYSTRPSTGH